MHVVDFGSVKLQLDPGVKLTMIGTTVGSPYYMSPEQAIGRSDIDQRTDVFALGVMVYEMLTGHKAFMAKSIGSILTNIINQNPVAPSTLRSDLPEALDAVLAQSMCKDKNERYATATQLVEAFAQACGLPEGYCSAWSSLPPETLNSQLPQPLQQSSKPAPSAPSEDAPASELAASDDDDAKTLTPALPTSSSRIGLWIALGVLVGLAVVAAWKLLGA